MGKVFIRRMSDGVDVKLRKEQAGFRQDRADNIAKEAVEWNSSLHVCFVNYVKTFDSIHRNTLWKIMGSYGIPPKLVRMVVAKYDGSSSLWHKSN